MFIDFLKNGGERVILGGGLTFIGKSFKNGI